MAKRSKSWSKWTPEVVENFKIDYVYLDWDELLKRYPFAKGSLVAKASELGVKRRTGKQIKYSHEEDRVIIDHFNNGFDDEEIGRLLGRTASSVTCRRQKLGLLVRPGAWTEHENNILRMHYNSMPAADVTKMLPGRSKDAVVLHAAVLGLSGYRSYHEYTPDEELYISQNYLAMSDSEMGAVLGHPEASIKNRRNKLGLHRPKMQTKYEDAVAYFRKHNSDWKHESMRACGYKCYITGERFDEIHHLVSLNTIVAQACDNAGIDLDQFNPNTATDEDKSCFLEAVKAEQAKYPLGVCLRREEHTRFHNKYGYGNNTAEQFIEFLDINYPNCPHMQ